MQILWIQSAWTLVHATSWRGFWILHFGDGQVTVRWIRKISSWMKKQWWMSFCLSVRPSPSRSLARLSRRFQAPSFNHPSGRSLALSLSLRGPSSNVREEKKKEENDRNATWGSIAPTLYLRPTTDKQIHHRTFDILLRCQHSACRFQRDRG